MGQLYDKPVRQLMKEMIPALGIKVGQVFSKEQVRTWFESNYPKIKDGTINAHLIRLSINAPSRIHYSVKPKDDDVFFQIDGSHFRLYASETDPSPIYEKEDEVLSEEVILDEPKDLSEFAYEKDLQNFLARNLHAIEANLSLYEDEGIKGIEFPVGGRFIDILAIDTNGDLVVIELKVSRGYDRVVGQLLRYMAWIRKNHAEADQKVRGMIIAREISEDLILACSGLDDIELFEYSLSVSVDKIHRD